MEILEGSRERVESEGAKIIAQVLNEIIDETGKAVFAIPGGRSVPGIFRNLLKEKVIWDKVEIVMIDERFVPLDSEESNFRLAKESFISELLRTGKIKEENVHPFIFTEGKEELSIELYGSLVNQLGNIDLVLVSSGEDGHIAALYPRHEALESEGGFIEIRDSPKPPSHRMTASPEEILKAKVGVVLFSGKEKDEAYKKFNSQTSWKECPAKLIQEIPRHIILRWH